MDLTGFTQTDPFKPSDAGFDKSIDADPAAFVWLDHSQLADAFG